MAQNAIIRDSFLPQSHSGRQASGYMGSLRWNARRSYLLRLAVGVSDDAIISGRKLRLGLRSRMLIGATTAAALVGWATVPSFAADLTPQEAKQIGVDAYIYGYSLMTSDVTEKAFVNTTAPSPQAFQAPLNQLVNIPKYPPADYKGVTAPNADTLYTAYVDGPGVAMSFSGDDD
jgi:hypothetical protein